MALPQAIERALPLSWRAKARKARKARAARKEREEAEFTARMRAMAEPAKKPREGLIVGLLGSLLLRNLANRLQDLLDTFSQHRAQSQADTQAAVKLALDAVRREAVAQQRTEAQRIARAVELGVAEGMAAQSRAAKARESWLAVEALAGRRLAEATLQSSSPPPAAALNGLLALHKLTILADAQGTAADPIEAWKAGDPALCARMAAELDTAMVELVALHMLDPVHDDWRSAAPDIAARLDAVQAPSPAVH